MQELDLEGLFWRPEEPDHKLAGRLRFNPTDGGVLSIIYLDSLGAGIDDGGVRFLGAAGSHDLTLDQCHLIGGSQESTGQRRYQVFTVLTGAHFRIDEPLRFRSVALQLSNLVQWVGRSGLSVERPRDEFGRVNSIRINYTTVPRIEARDGSIVVAFPRRFLPDPFGRSTIEQQCVLEYHFHEPQSLSKIMQVCSALRNLVTICLRAPSAILNMTLTYPDFSRPIDFYPQWLGADYPRVRNSIHRPKMLLTFDDIGGVEGIRAWLESASRYSELIAMLVHHWYTPTLYLEQRYFHAVVAVEMLIRIRRKRNIDKGLNLARALGDLVQEVKSLFEPLVGDPEKWTREVVRSRDNYVVHPGLKGSSDWHRLSLLSESIYVLVVLTLLRECGVSMESLEKIQNHWHYKWLADKLRSSA